MTQQPDKPANRYRYYVLFVLTLVYAFNFIDRQILVILQGSIAAELGLSDTQLGWLSGLAFALFYVTAGIPIAIWADRGNRRNIVALALTVWSGMTALSGMAQNFWHLLAARLGVGIGEAGGSPPSHSMISDYFPPERRGTAISIYSTGIYLGILVGYLLGGWIDQTFGWRVAFFVVGVPGILLALVVRFTVREPIRGMSENIAGIEQLKLGELAPRLWALRSFRYLALGGGVTAFGLYGTGNFAPLFLARSHGMSSAEIGVVLALLVGFGGMGGTAGGGWLADKLGGKDKRWYLWVPIMGGVIAGPTAIAAFLVQDTTVALTIYFVAVFTSAVYLGPLIAISHTLVPQRARALTSAILFFILNLVGMGMGPLSTGMISDSLKPEYGDNSLRYAMVIISCISALTLLLFYLASRHLNADLAAQKDTAPTAAD